MLRKLKVTDYKTVKYFTELYYEKGFNYHQAEVAKSRDLLAWVRRADYFDTTINSEIGGVNE